MLYAFGVGEVPISISGAVDENELLVHTIRDVGAVTHFLANLQVGDRVGVRGPFGSSWPIKKAEGHDLVVVAGGLGLVPLRPVLYYLDKNRQKFKRVYLLYGTRQPEDVLFQSELKQWAKQMDLEVTVDHAGTGWRSHVGVVTQLISDLRLDSKTFAFVCGPDVMMKFTAQDLLKKGLDSNNIYLSLERNMKCGVGHCGHCQYGPEFICKEGPVFILKRISRWMNVREF